MTDDDELKAAAERYRKAKKAVQEAHLLENDLTTQLNALRTHQHSIYVEASEATSALWHAMEKYGLELDK